MRILIPLLLVIALLGGCAGNDTPDTSADEPTDDVATTGDADTADGVDDAPAAVPTPLLELSVQNGTAPVETTITLSAVNAAGDPWRLTSTLGDNVTELASGTDLPATVDHVFEAPGIHELTFSILANETVEATASVEVTAPEPEPIDLVTTQTLEGTLAAGAVDPESEVFQVPEGAYAVSAWVTWALPEVGEGIVVTDIDTSMQANGREVASAGSGSYEWLHHKDDAGIEAGEYTVILEPFATGVETPYTIHVMVWMAPVMEAEYTGAFEGEAAAATETTVSHDLALDAPIHAMSAHLQWGTPESPSCGTANAKSADLDLTVKSGAELFSSGNFGSCEFGSKDADLGGSIAEGSVEFIIAPYEAPATEYLLTVWYV